MSAPSKYELVWAATYALEFKAFREQPVTVSDVENAQWAMRRADRAVTALIDAEKSRRSGAGEDSVTAALSPTMAEALARCRGAGGLKYVRGGFWIETTQDPAPFERLSGTQRLFAVKPLSWSTTTHTIKALLKRGVVFEPEEGRRADYPTLVRATSPAPAAPLASP